MTRAGFIGLEFAATARAKGLEVDVVELAPRVMARAVTAEMHAGFQARRSNMPTRSLFTFPFKTIWTISIVSSSV